MNLNDFEKNVKMEFRNKIGGDIENYGVDDFDILDGFEEGSTPEVFVNNFILKEQLIPEDPIPVPSLDGRQILQILCPEH